MQIALGHYYARKHPGIFFASMHPGWSDTPGVRSAMPDFFKFYEKTFRSALQGADTILWLACSPNPLPNGGFFRDRAIELEHFWLGGTSYPEEHETLLYNWLSSKAQ
jgi:dehydrogenase/reductase SDR family member 12